MDIPKLGDVGTAFMFENDLIRVWNLELSPGESSDWHRHNSNYCFVVTRSGSLKGEHESGKVSISQLEVGEVVMGQKGAVHRVTNVGDEIYSNIVIEIK